MIFFMFISMFLINILMPIIMIYRISDYYISLNNIYSSLFMASAMILAMRLYMNVPNNILILQSIILVFSYLALRNQWFVNDTFFLRDMIPHHSMALQTSSHIIEKTQDLKIKELANNIYNSQIKEIDFMRSKI